MPFLSSTTGGRSGCGAGCRRRYAVCRVLALFTVTFAVLVHGWESGAEPAEIAVDEPQLLVARSPQPLHAGAGTFLRLKATVP
ncbi:MAG: hypothetical protein JJU00_05505 [Opitutales bacterium]|nr:hypothetical protein [Opitutales bacterium]